MDSSGSTIGGTALQKNNGSWIPLVSLLCLLLMRWICYSNGNRPVQIRRWFNAKSVQMRKQLGLRDDSIYQSGSAGQGARTQLKRQG